MVKLTYMYSSLLLSSQHTDNWGPVHKSPTAMHVKSSSVHLQPVLDSLIFSFVCQLSKYLTLSLTLSLSVTLVPYLEPCTCTISI